MRWLTARHYPLKADLISLTPGLRNPPSNLPTVSGEVMAAAAAITEGEGLKILTQIYASYFSGAMGAGRVLYFVRDDVITHPLDEEVAAFVAICVFLF
jgi:hypothetical protein